jgi:hypothetical protein
LTQEKHQQLSKVSALPMTEPKLPKKVVVVTLLSLKKRKFKTSEKHKSQENVEWWRISMEIHSYLNRHYLNQSFVRILFWD